MVRTRFAPSPTGFLHIGGARTALFAWAFARRHGGTFILRIEDTDVARSSQAAVDGILAAMDWLGLDYDEGPYYQMQRMPRYRAVVQEMLADGRAYLCYTTPEELDALRESQRARGEKPRYDGRWRPEPGKVLPPVPAGVTPVTRFRNPTEGSVVWEDAVKGRIEFANSELDDLVIARPDGTPTYNFCVVVDDHDMQISHVIRGDDHVNNTPRQINILAALGAPIPVYAHVSMILGDDGQKLSKRHGAVNVMEYRDNGYLPEAVVNYLARLGWSHGDDEVFSPQQLCAWFDLDHITPSAAQFNTEKLNWLNGVYLRQSEPATLLAEVAARLAALGVTVPASGPTLEAVVALYRERAVSLNDLVAAARMFYCDFSPDPAALAQHLSAEALPALADFVAALEAQDPGAWNAASLGALIKSTVGAHGLKMPRLAMPLRILLTGSAQSPSVDALLAAFPPALAIARLRRGLAAG